MYVNRDRKIRSLSFYCLVAVASRAVLAGVGSAVLRTVLGVVAGSVLAGIGCIVLLAVLRIAVLRIVLRICVICVVCIVHVVCVVCIVHVVRIVCVVCHDLLPPEMFVTFLVWQRSRELYENYFFLIACQ